MSAPVQIDGPHRPRGRTRLLRALATALSTLGTVLALALLLFAAAATGYIAALPAAVHTCAPTPPARS